MPDAIYTGVSESHLGSLPPYGITVPSGAGGFGPLQLAGLRFWQEATAITGKSTADPITQWDDASGNANHFTEATNTPTYRATDGPNSLPCVRFDAVNDVLSKTGIATDTSFTCFIVAKERSAPTATQRHFWSQNGGASNLFTGTGSGPGFNWFANQAGTVTAIGGTPANWNIVVVRENSQASLDVYLNGGTATNMNPDDTVGTTTARVLGSASTASASPSDFDIYGYIEYDTALAAADVNRVGNYLAAKTAITWTTAT